jgi:hypothetical protein
MRSVLHQSATRLVLGAVVLLVVAAGAAYATAAAMSSADTAIVACQNQTNGLLRVVTDPTNCRTAETAISWNQVGPQGPPGEQGPKGDPGPAGALIATRIHNVGQTTSGAWSAETLWPLTGGVWTQAAGALNLLFGQATVKVPAACDSASVPPGGQFLFPAGYVTVFVDGEQLAVGLAIFTPGFGGPSNAGQSVRVPLSFNPIFPPAAATSHTLTVKVKDGCGGAGQDFTFESLEVDVVGVG